MTDRYERRASPSEVASLGTMPSYLTSIARGKSKEEEAYLKNCFKLWDREIKAHPGYTVRMSIENGVPRFYGYRQSLTDMRVRKRIARSLNQVRSSIEKGASSKATVSRINRILRKISEDDEFDE